MNVYVKIVLTLEISWARKNLQFCLKMEVEPSSETSCLLQYMKYTSHALGNDQRNTCFSYTNYRDKFFEQIHSFKFLINKAP